MVSIYKKKLKNKDFYYLTERVRVGEKYIKIQVYLGKTVPKDLHSAYASLAQKEIDLLGKSPVVRGYSNQKSLSHVADVARITWKYFFANLSPSAQKRFWARFAIRFIFESNAIEGSRLSQREVEKIIRKGTIRKSASRVEIQEVRNALRAFEQIQSKNFRLNQRSIKSLHAIVTKDLNITQGYKQHEVIVNNRPTAKPGTVRSELSKLFTWYETQKKGNVDPFLLALDFHARFERIHPFEDGNGRTGRMILNWMLLRSGYGMILIPMSSRVKYWNALGKADDGQSKPWHVYGVATYKNTVKEFTS